MNLYGNNNGTWGYGMSGVMLPANMNGPFGSQGMPLPNVYQMPTGTFPRPYRFGSNRRSSRSPRRKSPPRSSKNRKNSHRKSMSCGFGTPNSCSMSCGFGSPNSQVEYALTPGGYTTENSWGFKNNLYGIVSAVRVQKSKKNHKHRKSPQKHHH